MVAGRIKDILKELVAKYSKDAQNSNGLRIYVSTHAVLNVVKCRARRVVRIAGLL
jgi:hypothetical protein